jgi:hypothetical protein
MRLTFWRAIWLAFFVALNAATAVRADSTVPFTVDTTQWVNLGTGPLQVQSHNAKMLFAYESSQPSVGHVGFDLQYNYTGWQEAHTTLTVWAIAAAGSGSVVVAPISSATVLLGASSAVIGSVVQGGSTGTDASANAASIPISGYSLLTTIAANPTRAYVEVQNQSAGQIQLVRDDGAGANQSSVILASGGVNAQGGGWSSATFKGRVRVYGASGSQVSAFQD